jgi:hypothetical protein
MLSQYQLSLLGIDDPEMIIPSSTPKLIPNLFDKEKYIIHYRNLQLYLELGMQLKKVCRYIYN